MRFTIPFRMFFDVDRHKFDTCTYYLRGIIVRDSMVKTIVSVSKKNNSVWRMYFYDFNDSDEYVFQSKRINRLLVWFYKLQKQKLCSDICMICQKEFKFYKKRFESSPDGCSECMPEEYPEY